MYIKHISLQNFRNYEKLKVDFNQLGNIIIGDNGNGKTNIIESIYVGSLGKSFRTKKDSELIKFDQNYYTLSMNIVDDDIDYNIKIICLKNGKKQIKVNDIPLEKGIELIGRVKIVIFTQEDMQLLRGNPQDRRNQFDRFISLINYNYKNSLLLYNKILKQRNFLLKNVKKETSKLEELDIWDSSLSKIGAILISDRLKIVNELNKMIGIINIDLSSKSEFVRIVYSTDVNYEKIDNSKIEYFENELYKKMKLNVYNDVKMGFTTVGPHKDDYIFFINDFDARKFASQGQQRTLVLSLKIAESRLIFEKFRSYPILLLDDVMSELDTSRQEKLLRLIDKCQTIITTTDLDGINEYNNFNIFEVDNGRIHKYGGIDE